MDKINKFDIALIAAVIAASVVLAVINLTHHTPGYALEITVGGELYKILPLSEDTEIDVRGLCTVKIEDGYASIPYSTCRNKICIAHRPINSPGESVICAPNGVVIRVTGELEESTPDFVQ